MGYNGGRNIDIGYTTSSITLKKGIAGDAPPVARETPLLPN